MSYIPPLSSGSYTGWLALQRQMPVQRAVFEKQPLQQRQAEYFRENIGSIQTAEDLVKDRQLLSVALGAFGLGDDINNKFYIRKILEGGTMKEGALALRLSDPRYREMSGAFGFGDFDTPSTVLSDFAEKIIAAWQERSFETAVGQVNENLRLGLNVQRELTKLAEHEGSSDRTKWYSILGQPPLRKVFEVVFNLPLAFGVLNVDRQVELMAEKAQAFFGNGSPAQFADPKKMDQLVRRFLLQSDIASATGAPNAAVRGSAALSLLQMRKT